VTGCPLLAQALRAFAAGAGLMVAVALELLDDVANRLDPPELEDAGPWAGFDREPAAHVPVPRNQP
jgi:hypothetical protein